MKREGFLLLEFLISLFVGGLIVLASCYFMCSALSTSYRMIGMCSTVSRLVCASSLIENLLSQAPASRIHWKRMARDELVWSGKESDNGLSLQGEELVFIVGVYDVNQQGWLHKTNRSVVLEQVKELAFSYHSDRPINVHYKLVTATDWVEKDIDCLGSL